MAYSDHNNSDDDELERQRLLQALPIVNLNENILPLPGGRRAHTLAEFSQTDSNEKQLSIEKTRTAFEKELQELDNVDDPLEIYVRYLQWITDTFPSGDNKESQLFVVLQKTCHQFQDDNRYTLHPGYLKCWLRLAKFMEDPKDVYELLRQKGIGQNLALFYEEYASLYEKRAKYEEARLILQKGVQRRAQPLRRLEQNLERFNIRVEKAQHMQSQGTSSPNAIQNQAGSRTILGVKLDPKLRESMPQTRYNNLQNSSSTSLSRRPLGNSLSSTTPLQRQTQKFTILSDHIEDQAESSSQTLMNRVFPPIPTSPSKVPKVSLTKLARHPAENIPNVEKPGHSAMPMDPSYVRPPKLQFDICRDDDNNTATTHNSPFSNRSSSSSTLPARDADTIFEARFQKMKHLLIHTTDSSGNPEIIAAHSDCTGGPGATNPISFEELRLIRQVDRTGKPQSINGKAPRRIILPKAEESIPRRVGRGRSPTMEYTAETLEAMKAVGAIFGDRQDKDEQDDDDDDEDQYPKRRKQTFVNENN